MLERDALHSLNASLMQAERSSAEGLKRCARQCQDSETERCNHCIANRVLRNGMAHSRENNDDGDHKKPLSLESISFSKSKESPTIDSVAS